MSHNSFAIMASLFLTSCEQKPASSAAPKDEASPRQAVAATPTVRDLVLHPEQHGAIKKKCRGNPGELRHNAACANADRAQRQIFDWGQDEARRRVKSEL